MNPELDALINELRRCEKWIINALEYCGGTYTLQDVVVAILEKRMQFWPAPNGCAVTELIQFPQMKIMHIFLAGGDLEQFFDMENDAIKWAKSQGCAKITLTGRKGWTKVLLPHGWEPTLQMVEKRI